MIDFSNLDKSMNTLFSVIFIDIYAVKEALENEYNVDNVWFDYNEKNDGIESINFTYGRMAYNGTGYHVGYEEIQVSIKAYDRNELALYGIPMNLSNYVVNLNQYTIKNRSYPATEYPTIDSHLDNCPVLNRDEGNEWIPDEDHYPDDCDCGCNENWNGYYPPEDDFWHSELESLFSYLSIPNAVFDAKLRQWEIGNQIAYQLP